MATRNLKSYRHHPLTLADQEFDASHKKLYRVTTINWTFATIRGHGQDFTQVHRNIYHFTLEKLIDFIRATAEVAEDIVSIEPIHDENAEHESQASGGIEPCNVQRRAARRGYGG